MLKQKPIRLTAQRREVRSDESRAKILAAAERAFAGEGFAGARTDAIAAEAGVNKALLYYYYKSKEQLYEAVLEEQLREFNDRALAVLTAPGAARVLLLDYLQLHFDFISERRLHAALFQQLMMKGGKGPERLFRKYIAPRGEALRNLLARGMRSGEFRKVDPFHTAISIVALVVFYFSAAPMFELMGYSDPYAANSLKLRKQQVLDLVRHGLFVDTGIPEI
ncbi:MAG TPA: TetR/AcrR family transcriptional regulator [Verrucomicrobiae bacterium]|nr:TetR/AcrR family transcriptional regulator [Verrucomicrobiae bacterium]